jgi:hypothetical protein
MRQRRVIQEQFPVRDVREGHPGLPPGLGFVDFLWMLVLALAMVALVPQGVGATADALSTRPWGSLGWGIVLLIGVPIAVVALAVILVGIPVAVVLLLAHLLAVFASHAAAALAIGRIAITRASAYAQVIIGVLAIAIATNLPVAGVFLRLAVTWDWEPYDRLGRRSAGGPNPRYRGPLVRQQADIRAASACWEDGHVDTLARFVPASQPTARSRPFDESRDLGTA